MKMLKQRMVNLFAVALLIIPGVSMADFKSDIIASCTAYQQGHDVSEVNACKLYIDGFIDSSLLAKDAVVKPQEMIDQDSSKPSEYLTRAYESRVFNSPSSSVTQTSYQFCTPLEYDRKLVASRVAKSLDIKKLMEKPLKVVVLETLIDDFSCQQ
jgi:hypothetical protein